MRFPYSVPCGGASLRASGLALTLLALGCVGSAHAQLGLDAGAAAQVDDAPLVAADGGPETSAQTRLALDAGAALDAGYEPDLEADGGDAAVGLALVPPGPRAQDVAPPLLAAAPLDVKVIDVTVRRGRSQAQRLQQSAEAVSVVDLKQARARAADLGEVLARTQGIGVRREGGLGSGATLQMNGLEGDQIRTFLDGVPLVLAGFPNGIQNIPVNMLEQIEIYRGVVPVRFGADALGGAINLVTDTRPENHAAASYQVGSFGTHRTTVSGLVNLGGGYIVGANGYLDWARNDFTMHDRSFAQPDGSSVVRDAKRFHDAYKGYGANLKLGVVEKRWAKRLTVDGFVSNFDKEIQHNPVMTLPFGEMRRGVLTGGATARYDVDVTEKVELSALVNYARSRIDFQDKALYRYGWDGKQTMRVGRGALAAGESNGTPIDESIYENGVYARLQVSYRPAPDHLLRFASTPHRVGRATESNLTDRPTEPRLDDDVFRLVSGVEYELSALDERLENIAFAKSYFFRASSEDFDSATTFRSFTHESRRARFGAGDSLRYRFASWVYAKVSYEYATRLPDVEELFGNGALIEDNADLKPEVSHNANLGPRFELKHTPLGDFIIDLNLFLRDTRNLIVRIADQGPTAFSNIGNARSLGAESSAGWTSRRRWVNLGGTFTYQDVRNTSEDGLFAPYEGERIPSRPWMFASWGGGLRFADLPDDQDTIEPYYAGRYTHGYTRGWESVGDPKFKIRVPNMVSHDVGVTYTKFVDDYRLGAAFTVSNLTDARLYDTFGVERPGRAYYFKMTGDL